MRTIPLVKEWSGECGDVVGRLELTDDHLKALELVGDRLAELERLQCNARLDFAMEKRADGTVEIVAARIRPEPAMPVSSP